MNELIKVLLIIGGYFLIALVVYLLLYCVACKNYKESSYTDFNIYLDRETECLSLMSLVWPFYIPIVGITSIY